ncbi:MAG: Co2+/Mg2+ efflux protein ApaG [Chromatiaceae bacterium]|jgi:ApaG protein|nr:Co2+/Mg2+ efflux protein ApaG [Chromatiaceae bacterium]
METSTDARYRIEVSVRCDYLPEQSQPDDRRFAFAYSVFIENRGLQAARLISRHWIIADADGRVQEVRGEGVVGKQPYLRPGESYRYTSGTVLETPIGSMHGSYQMLADDGTRFDAEIHPFSLATPTSLH